MSDIIKDKKTGIIVNSFDYKDYANKLYHLINDKELRKYMSKEGPKLLKINILIKHLLITLIIFTKDI